MFRILSTTAVAMTLALPVLAESHVMTPRAQYTQDEMAELIRTRDITGGPVYSIGDVYDETTWMDETYDYEAGYGYETMGYGTDRRQIGEIEDIILDRSGQMVGIVAEVGGFLDIGDKHVMLTTDDVRLVPVDDTSYSFVTRYTEEQLEELEGVNEGWWN